MNLVIRPSRESASAESSSLVADVSLGSCGIALNNIPNILHAVCNSLNGLCLLIGRHTDICHFLNNIVKFRQYLVQGFCRLLCHGVATVNLTLICLQKMSGRLSRLRTVLSASIRICSATTAKSSSCLSGSRRPRWMRLRKAGSSGKQCSQSDRSHLQAPWEVPEIRSMASVQFLHLLLADIRLHADFPLPCHAPHRWIYCSPLPAQIRLRHSPQDRQPHLPAPLLPSQDPERLIASCSAPAAT